MDLHHLMSKPQERGNMNIQGKNVTFYYCVGYSMGHPEYTWRADCNNITIASMCKTKKECIAEAREYLCQEVGNL